MRISLKQVIHFPLIKIILSQGICFILLVGVQNLITKPLFRTIIASRPIADTIINYISVAVLLLSYFYVFRVYDRRKITELSTKNLPVVLGGSFVFGFSVLSLVILILYMSGYYSATGISNFSYLLAPFSVLVVAALLEEIFFRLIIYRIFEEWLGSWIALLIISVAFAFPHFFNDHVSILSVLLLLIFGFAHAIMYTYTKRVWLPFAFHLGWNFAQPFYGSNLSGIEEPHMMQSVFKGPTLLIGSKFGIEDSILSILLLMIISVFFLVASIRQGKMVPRYAPTPP